MSVWEWVAAGAGGFAVGWLIRWRLDLAAAKREARRSRDRIRDLTEEREDLAAYRKEADEELEGMRILLRERDDLLAKKEEELEQGGATLRAAEARIEETEAARSEVAKGLRAAERAIEDAERRLEEHGRRAAELEEAYRVRDADCDALLEDRRRFLAKEKELASRLEAVDRERADLALKLEIERGLRREVVRKMEATVPDDLTTISGIGPVYRDRLVESGIATIADLACADPERIREILQISEKGAARPEYWIEQARDRTG